MLNLRPRFFALLPFFAFLFSVPSAAQVDACGTKGVSLDHVIWAVPDLADYVARFESISGIKPVYGGQHTNGVTENYLVSLGPCTYLEIVGPQQGVTPEMLGDRAATYAREHIAGFAFGVDMDNPPEALKTVALGIPSEGGRTKPDGSTLAWKTAPLIDFDFGEGTFQFVIDWQSEPHPATTSAEGATIMHLTIANPGVTQLTEIVETNKLPIVLQPSGRPGMWLRIKTERGSITLK